jgi:hypothetical protein
VAEPRRPPHPARPTSSVATRVVTRDIYTGTMQETVVAVFCTAGPYRYVRELLKSAPDVWFPWGYRRCQVAIYGPDVAALRGREIELWAVDDTRAPTQAEFVGRGRIDFVIPTRDYLAFTIRSTNHSASSVAPDAVVERVRAGFLIFEPNVPIVIDGSAQDDSSVQVGSAVPAAAASFPLG